MQIGILGGTFDPPHIGHLIIAEQARVQLRLDQVWFAPAGQPVHKNGHHVTVAEHRVAMVELSIADNPCFKLCRVDVERPAPHYSLDLVRILRQQHPQHQWHFVIGSDSLADLPKWHAPEEIIKLVRLAVAQRPGYQPDLAALERAIPGLTQRIDWISAPMIEVSSTDLRARAQKGWPLRYIVPEAVDDYARANGLYGLYCADHNKFNSSLPSL
jgi:nicotinate-nucleotide adenylyltransferase